MSDYSNFVSDSSIKAKEEEKRQARKSILEKAKKKYEAEERREKKKKESGEATWMLDTVSKRIHKEQKTLEDAKSRKKKKKEKKKKKKKKHHKHSSSSSSSSEENEGEETWVESKTASSNTSQSSSGKVQRESWMEAPLDFLPSVTRQELRDEANKEKEKAKREAEKHLQPGQHARELNPYWKNGGSGLPSAQPSTTSTSSSSSGAMGDGGLSWMLKSLTRMKEQAKEEGRSLEDIAAERYGSLDRLMSMIRDAEKSQGRGRDGNKWDSERQERKRFSDRDKDSMRDRNRERDSDRDRDSSRHRDRRSSEREESRLDDRRDRDRRESKNYSHQRSGFQKPGSGNEHDSDSYDKKDRHREEIGKSSSNRRFGFRRPGSDDEDDDRSNEKDYRRDANRQESKSSSRFRRPGSDDDDSDEGSRSRYQSESRTFRKPGEVEDNDRGSYSKSSSSSSSSHTSRHRDDVSSRTREYDNIREDRRDGWRKSPKRSSEVPRWKKESGDVKDGQERESDKMRDRSRRKSSSSSSDSSDGDEDDNDHEAKEMSDSDEGPKTQPPIKVMSEAELNALAAKVLRAEIMGDEDLASQLKSTLEEARRVRESSKSTSVDGQGDVKDFVHSNRMVKGGKRGKEDEQEQGGDDNVVVLSRTNKAGMVRPVLPSSASEEWGGRSGGKKRKRKNVATHNEGGERTKFFHDDDNFDLKTLVEREKAGTAEDQNSMFARLAGRETDRDMDVDDMFVNKAARGRQEEEAVNRDKMAAIMEHRKKSSAMEKCTRCFDKVPKHLIIAIGRKSYLCLPDHASLSEGHCLIVPMAHSTSATSMDEDVWQDMQQFRKSLVRMFLSQEKDVVVMETVMHLKHFPHTAIECVPLERELGDLAPIYFKKAMQEVGPEWSHNKKVHDLSKKDVRHTVPKGFPYFSVDFGLQGGFAHVIEDEATFPNYFGREIVGGMLDAEPGLWRKPRKQNFEDQRQKVLQFEQWWSPFDWTQDIG